MNTGHEAGKHFGGDTSCTMHREPCTGSYADNGCILLLSDNRDEGNRAKLKILIT